MDPERTTHENPILTPGTPELDAVQNQLDAARTAYLAEKNNSRGNVRSFRRWAWARIRNRENPDQRMQNTRQAYEATRNRVIQIQARINTDAAITETHTDADYRQRLAQEVAEQVIAEMRNVQQSEIANRHETWYSRASDLLRRHPLARTAIGLGLNVAIGASAATGMLPLTWALIGARVGFGAIGMEGAISGVGNALAGRRGDRAELTQAQVGAMNMADVRRRIAAFSESRTLDRTQAESPTETRLMERYRDLIRDQVRAEMDAAGPGGTGIENWKRLRAEATAQEAARAAAETARDAAETERVAKEAERVAAETARDAAAAEALTKEAEMQATETARDQAEADIKQCEKVFADPTVEPVLSVVKDIGDLDAIKDACRDYVNAERRINELNAMTPPLTAAQVTERGNEELKKTTAQGVLTPLVTDVARATIAYKGLMEATDKKTTKEAEMQAAEEARNEAMAEADTKEDERVAAEAARDAAEATRVAKEAERAAAEVAKDRANNISQDQAIMIHDILLGGVGRTGADSIPGRPDIAAIPIGILAQTETVNQELDARMREQRRNKLLKWGAAFAASGFLTALTLPELQTVNFTTPDNFYGDPNVLGNPDVSSLWGQAEAAWMSSHGLNPNDAADIEKFRNILQGPNKEGILRGLVSYTNFVRENAPIGAINGDLVNHNVNIVAPGNLPAFFNNATGNLDQFIRNFPVNVPNGNILNIRPI